MLAGIARIITVAGIKEDSKAQQFIIHPALDPKLRESCTEKVLTVLHHWLICGVFLALTPLEPGEVGRSLGHDRGFSLGGGGPPKLPCSAA